MSVWGLLEKAAEVVGGPVVTGAIEGGKALAGLFGTTTVSGQATMSPEALVKMITTGPGSQGLEPERQDNTDKAQVQNQIEDETRQHMTTLESAWTGGGADAARDKLQQATSPVAASSQAMTTNAGTISGQMEVFTTLKNSLHTDVSDSPPQKGAWDTVTPWDTDTEDAINANNAKVQENLDAYNSYTQSSQSYAPQLQTDYGQVTDISGNTFQIEQPTPPTKKGPDHTENTVGGSDHSNGSSAYSNNDHAAASIPRQSIDSPGLSTTAAGNTTTGQSGSLSGSLDDATTAAGYPTPGTSGSTANPAGPGAGSTPAGPGSSSSGFGPLGGMGLGPMGGAGLSGGSGSLSGGPGSGSSSGGGSGALSGGKATGGVAGEAGATGAKSGAATAAGAAGRSGTSGMGGAGTHGGKGKGEDDAEHQRPSYLVEADPDSVFGSDEKTAPPVIGL